MSISLAAAVEAIKSQLGADVVAPTLKGVGAVKIAMVHLDMEPSGRLKFDVQAVCTRLKIDTGWDPQFSTSARSSPAAATKSVANGGKFEPLPEPVPFLVANAPIELTGNIFRKDTRTKPAIIIQTHCRSRFARKHYKQLKRREAARRHVVKEIYTTEMTYNACLTTLDQFISQLQFQASVANSPAQSSKSSKPPKGRRQSVHGMAWEASVSGREASGSPSSTDIVKIFGNVADFLQLSNDLVARLHERVGDRASQWKPSSRVSDVFVTLASGFNGYQKYAQKFEEASEHLGRCSVTYPLFAMLQVRFLNESVQIAVVSNDYFFLFLPRRLISFGRRHMSK
eukprot:SAG31_NODE_3145_length_4621_cov_2.448695_1_plen_341_part_00